MGSAETFNEIQMAVPDNPTDYASSYSVEVSPNGSAWSVVATCMGTGTPEVVSFPSQTDQYVAYNVTSVNGTPVQESAARRASVIICSAGTARPC